ncbi:hypothetical protein E2C01_016171 [Portunus trituberculatus]|uniref:Uncharacterized protein n=1 Tax=Portunus trituberculatus TaxID=210409 RepID=A0A5B7DNE0_PORTR|nr:hypothetical protein [Portunus trituberculatus]
MTTYRRTQLFPVPGKSSVVTRFRMSGAGGGSGRVRFEVARFTLPTGAPPPPRGVHHRHPKWSSRSSELTKIHHTPLENIDGIPRRDETTTEYIGRSPRQPRPRNDPK